MATAPDPSTHPLADYLANFQQARDLLVSEQLLQADMGDDDTLDVGVRAAARAAALELTDKIGLLDASKTRFLVGVVSATLPPSQALVDATVQLNTDLAVKTKADNAAAAYLEIVTAYLNGAAAVATGKVAAEPGGDG